MNKLIIIEGPDRHGKGSLIKGLCDYYDYKNIAVRHCDKPPKHLTTEQSSDFQFASFEQELFLIYSYNSLLKKYCYHDNIIIYDRFYPGEFVYAQMFRNDNSEIIKEKIWQLEYNFIPKNSFSIDNYLITLTSDPIFFNNLKSDGKEFSKTLEEKIRELELFKEVHNFSVIKNKLLVKVDNNGQFRLKEDILNEVLEFIKK